MDYGKEQEPARTRLEWEIDVAGIGKPKKKKKILSFL
jgi:hypothetical protein